MFVAVGHQGMRIATSDGQTWQDVSEGKEGEVFRAAAFGAGRFVAVATYGWAGENIFASSEDGKQWKLVTQKLSAPMLGLTFGDKFLAFGGDPGSVGAGRPSSVQSSDGVEWTDFASLPGGFILRQVAYGDGRYVGVGERGRRSMSKDGKLWQDVPDTKPIDTLIDIAYGAGRFVGVGLHALRTTSEDGLKWTDGVKGEEGEHLNSITWCGDRFVAVGLGATYLSPDGLKWERVPNKNAPLAVTYGDGLFIGSAWRARLLRSTDGITWDEVHRCPRHVESVAFGAVEVKKSTAP